MVVLPGNLGVGEMDFVQLVKNVPQGVLLVTFHIRGCGQSKPPSRIYPFDFYQRDADDCANIMEQLGFKHYSVLGWCSGGVTAMILTASNPQNVKNLILLSSQSYITKEDINRYGNMDDISRFNPFILRDLIAAHGDMEAAQSAWSSYRKTFFELFYRGGDLCQSKLRMIQCPTAILHGQDDILVPSFHGQYLHDNIKRSHLYMIDDGRHALQHQFPAKLQRLIQSLLIDGVFMPWDDL